MSNILRHIRDNQDKEEMMEKYGMCSKRRCPKCHRFTVYTANEKKHMECIRCMERRQEREKEGK